MITRLTDHLRGAAIGATITLAACAWFYLDTHKISFTATATNEPPAVQSAMAIESLMPLPERKPKVTP